MGRSGVGSPGLDQRAIRVGARQAPGAVEHGQGPIRLFMDPHRDRHLMEPGGGFCGICRGGPCYRTVFSWATTRSSGTHRISARCGPTPRRKAGPVPSPPPETGYDAAGERARAETGWPPPAPESRPAPTLRAVGPARCGAPASTEACRRGRPPPRWARRARPGRERGNGRAPAAPCPPGGPGRGSASLLPRRRRPNRFRWSHQPASHGDPPDNRSPMHGASRPDAAASPARGCVVASGDVRRVEWPA